MSALRYIIYGMLVVLVYRILKNGMNAILHQLHRDDTEVSGKPKKPPWDLDESQIQDAEFQDLDT